jgi:hypothetical protein
VHRLVALPTLLVTWLVVASCREVTPVEVTDDPVVLIGVSVAFSDSVFVVVGHSLPGRPASGESGADLSVQVRGRVVPLHEGTPGSCGRPLGFACYRARLVEEAHPGDTVRLEGTLASGGRVDGEAVVPPVPDIGVVGATAGDTVRGIRLSIGTPSPRVLRLGDVDGRVGVADSVVTATVWTGAGERRCPVHLPGPSPGYDLRRFRRVGVSAGPPRCDGAPDLPWDSMAVPVTFLRYDAHFTDWARQGSFLGGDGGFGLEGVVGVWGAAAPRTFVLVVTP